MVNRILLKKLYRDLRSRQWALLTLISILTVGMGCYLGMSSLYRDLDRSRADYYQKLRLNDFTAELKKAPRWTLASLKKIPNISQIEARINVPLRLLLPQQETPIVGQGISVPFQRRPLLNDILLKSGSWFSGSEAPEILLNEAFARANHLKPGDRLQILLLEQEYNLLVVGTAMSPEFVYLIGAGGGFAPDPGRFGVVYFSESFLEKASDLVGSYNQIVAQVYQNDPLHLEPTLQELQYKLDPYGLNTTPYYHQSAIRFLADELQGLKIASSVLPSLFLGVAALVLNVLLGRMVMQQRTTIGTLKAIGYSPFRLALHYGTFGLIIGIAGAFTGLLLGRLLQELMLTVYRQLFALPQILPHFYPDLITSAFIISCGFSLLGTLKGVWIAFRISPAQAMRPPAPERGGKIFLEYLGFWKYLSFPTKMSLRTVFRNPFRSLSSIIASLISTALMITALSNQDALHYLMNYEFKKVSQEDIQIQLRDPESLSALSELASLKSIDRLEAELIIHTELSYGPFKKRVGLIGLPPIHWYHTPRLADETPLAIPPVGLVLSEKLAEILQVKPGTLIRLKPLSGRRQEVSATVSAIIPSYLGLSAYASLEYLSRLIGEEQVANLYRVRLKNTDPSLIPLLNQRPQIMGIHSRKRLFEQMEQTFGETMGIAIGMMIFFAGLIAFGSVFNTTSVSLSEREREVATLKVLGYSSRKITRIFATESLLLNALGIALGLVAGIALVHLLSHAYNTELYRFPVVMYPSRFLFSAGLMACFIGMAQFFIFSRIQRLPWLQALKVKD
jgi:putative ABC transport system permease protein